VGVIICGDFNSGPGSYLLQKCAYRKVDYENSPHASVIKSIDLMFNHSMKLYSAYSNYYKQLKEDAKWSSFIDGHPPHTNFVGNFKECIDYILHNEK